MHSCGTRASSPCCAPAFTLPQSSFLPVDWDKVRQSCTANPLAGAGDESSGSSSSSGARRPKVVLVTGSAGFVGMHTAMELRKRGDGACSGGLLWGSWRALGGERRCAGSSRRGVSWGQRPVATGSGRRIAELAIGYPNDSALMPHASTGVLGIDNFNDYYPVALKRARQINAESSGVYTGGPAAQPYLRCRAGHGGAGRGRRRLGQCPSSCCCPCMLSSAHHSGLTPPPLCPALLCPVSSGWRHQ